MSRVWLKWKQSWLLEINSDRSVSQPRLSLSRPSGRAHKSPIMAENMAEQCVFSTVSLTVPGRDTPSSRPSAGRTRLASCCSLKPSWPESDGWTRRSSGPRPTAVYQVCIHPVMSGDKRTLLPGRSPNNKWASAGAPAEVG